MVKFSIKYLTFGLFLFAVACGGGGGGGSADPAIVKTFSNPRHIDSGDKTSILIEIRDPEPEALLVKIRFPINLTLIRNTWEVTYLEETLSDAPDIKATDATHTYLVYELRPNKIDYADGQKLMITFELFGQGDNPTGKLEVDVDVNSRDDFSISNPLFDSQSDATIIVGPVPEEEVVEDDA